MNRYIVLLFIALGTSQLLAQSSNRSYVAPPAASNFSHRLQTVPAKTHAPGIYQTQPARPIASGYVSQSYRATYYSTPVSSGYSLSPAPVYLRAVNDSRIRTYFPTATRMSPASPAATWQTYTPPLSPYSASYPINSGCGT